MKMSLYESGAKKPPRRRKVRERERRIQTLRGSMEETSVLMSTLNRSNTILDYRLLFLLLLHNLFVLFAIIRQKKIELIIWELIS